MWLKIEADDLEDSTRRIAAGRWTIDLDLKQQTLAIDAPVDREMNRHDARDRKALDGPLAALLTGTRTQGFVSASVLGFKAKLFDDGLIAAIELAAQRGCGRHPAKSDLIASVGRVLAGFDPADAGDLQGVVLGAARLGGGAVAAPPAVEGHVTEAVDRFLADERRSRPLGVFTWSDELAAIFRQDRMLQTDLAEFRGLDRLAGALMEDAALRSAYAAQRRFAERMTNPRALADLRDVIGDTANAGSRRTRGVAFFPPATSHEAEIVRELFSGVSVPEGFSMFEEMLQRIRDGRLDLRPTPDSGWYDHQVWALETLAAPERARESALVEWQEGYRRHLAELFQVLLAATRETHVKELEVPLAGLMVSPLEQVRITPRLTLEPLATFYLRRALAYRFVRSVLEEAFGPDALDRIHRARPDGPAGIPLSIELEEMDQLFTGAHVQACRELGLAPEADAGDAAATSIALRRFREWSARNAADPDLDGDLRAMVPIFYDRERGQSKVWAILGWASRPIEISFVQSPPAQFTAADGAAETPRIEWKEQRVQVAYPVAVELFVDRLLDRDEFRALCDEEQTFRGILTRLGAPPRSPRPASTGAPAQRAALFMPEGFPLAITHAALDAGRMQYIDVGQGEPVLFVHGTPTYSYDWRNVIAALRSTHRCIAPDLLGFGFSERPSDFAYTPEAHAGALAELVDRLKLRDFTLVVHDFGGPIALPLALRDDARVKRLVVINSWMWSLAGDPFYARGGKVLGSPFGRFLYERLNFSLRVIVPGAYGDRRKLTPALHRVLLDRFRRPASRGAALWTLARSLLGSSDFYDSLWQRRERLRTLPALVVWGMKDPAFPPRLLARWREALPQAEVVEIAGAGHWPHEEEPDRVIAALQHFLGESVRAADRRPSRAGA